MIRVTRSLSLNPAEIEESFVRSSGPGGQNVNKVATAVQLRFDVRNSPSLPDEVKVRLMRLAGARMTKEGELVILARTHRSQDRNRDDALQRLIGLIRRAAAPPVPRTKTRTPPREKRKRREAKARRGQVKSLRGRPAGEE